MSSFTTERLIPDLAESGPMLVSHMARYRFAEPFVQTEVVLDTGCGCGYGTHHLAEAGASEAIGVDIAPEAIEYARNHYAAANVGFLVGDATALALGAERFGTVVCLEILEHVSNPEQLLSEARRVLKPAGKIIVSTPNKEVFSPRRARPVNPWHVREFYRDEFTSTLAKYFDDVQLWGQTLSVQGTVPFTLFHLHVQRYLASSRSMLSKVLGTGYGWILRAAMLSVRLAMGLMSTDPSVIAEVDRLPSHRTMYYIAVARKSLMAKRS